MRPFSFESVTTANDAIAAGASGDGGMEFLAGGTTLIDLMKLDVMRPTRVVDINALARTELGRIDVQRHGLRLGALVRMAEAAEHADINAIYPAVAQSLKLAASQQIRNMASLAGNVLQRTRCPYFRDVSYQQCNKREPGSGCAALDGVNRSHAVLGTSEQCIASYPGDFAQALIALGATVDIAGPRGTRDIPFAALHRKPGDAPDIETTLQSGEMITAFFIPAAPWTRRSVFLKIRDVRMALGGVATIPWRATAAEAVLKGKVLSARSKRAAADAAFADAHAHEHNAFKIELGKRTLIRALDQAAAMEI